MQQRYARERCLVAQVSFVRVMPVVNAFDDGQPSAVVQHTGELRHPGAPAIRRSFSNPQPYLWFALHRVLPAIRLFETDAEDSANRTPSHNRSIFLRATAVRPWRCDAAARLVIGELNRRQLPRGL